MPGSPSSRPDPSANRIWLSSMPSQQPDLMSDPIDMDASEHPVLGPSPPSAGQRAASNPVCHPTQARNAEAPSDTQSVRHTIGHFDPFKQAVVMRPLSSTTATSSTQSSTEPKGKPGVIPTFKTPAGRAMTPDGPTGGPGPSVASDTDRPDNRSDPQKRDNGLFGDPIASSEPLREKTRATDATKPSLGAGTAEPAGPVSSTVMVKPLTTPNFRSRVTTWGTENPDPVTRDPDDQATEGDYHQVVDPSPSASCQAGTVVRAYVSEESPSQSQESAQDEYFLERFFIIPRGAMLKITAASSNAEQAKPIMLPRTRRRATREHHTTNKPKAANPTTNISSPTNNLNGKARHDEACIRDLVAQALDKYRARYRSLASTADFDLGKTPLEEVALRLGSIRAQLALYLGECDDDDRAAVVEALGRYEERVKMSEEGYCDLRYRGEEGRKDAKRSEELRGAEALKDAKRVGELIAENARLGGLVRGLKQALQAGEGDNRLGRPGQRIADLLRENMKLKDSMEEMVLHHGALLLEKGTALTAAASLEVAVERLRRRNERLVGQNSQLMSKEMAARIVEEGWAAAMERVAKMEKTKQRLGVKHGTVLSLDKDKEKEKEPNVDETERQASPDMPYKELIEAQADVSSHETECQENPSEKEGTTGSTVAWYDDDSLDGVDIYNASPRKPGGL